MLAPVTPEPMMTYLELDGSSAVERKSDIFEGRVCQYDLVGLATGRPGWNDDSDIFVEVQMD
jgi:hypothetical protein